MYDMQLMYTNGWIASVPLRFSFNKFVQLKCYTTHSSCFVNIETFQVFIKLEQMLRYYSKFFNNFQNINWTAFLSAEFAKVQAKHISNCHNLYFKIIKKFATLRLKIYNRKGTACKRYDSKSKFYLSPFSQKKFAKFRKNFVPPIAFKKFMFVDLEKGYKKLQTNKILSLTV
jgi:hypothetical protein